MSRKLIVEVVADTTQFQKGMATSSTAAKGFSKEVKEIDRAARGALSGSGLLSGFTRSLAFASGGFVAFEGVSRFLTDSINAARDAGVAQRSLAAQMKASGESFQQNREQIEKTALSYERFGFKNDDVVKSLTILERGTGNVTDAIRLQALVADIARAKNIDLGAAANTVAKVFGHQETALRRAVPGLAKNAHGWDLIRLAQQKMAGQAAANTTVSERFAATLHDTEEIIGTALLPTLNEYLASLSTWLQKMNESGKLQKEAASGARGVAAAFKLAADGVKVAVTAITIFNKTKVEAKHVLGPLGFLVDNAEQAAERLKHAALTSNKAWDAILHGHIFSYPSEPMKKPPGLRGPTGEPSGFTPPGPVGPTAADVQAVKRTAVQLNAWFDAMVGRRLNRVQDAPLQQQLAMLQRISALVTRRIAVTKDITRKLHLEDQVLAISRQEAAVRQQLVQGFLDRLQFNVDKAGLTQSLADDFAALDAQQAGIEKRIQIEGHTLALDQQLLGVMQTRQGLQQQQAQAADAARQAARDEALAWADFAIERAAATKPLNDDLKAAQAKLKLLEQQAGIGKKTAEEARAIWEAQQEVTRIRKEMAKDQLGGTRFKPLDVKSFIASMGLNISVDQIRRLTVGLSQLGPGGVTPGQRSQAFAGGGVTVNGDVHVHGVQNTKQLEAELHKRARRRAHGRRGA